MISRFEQFSAAISGIQRYIQKIERIEMEKLGLKGHSVQCMLILKAHPEGMTSAKLCELCDKDKAAVSRTVSDLEKEDLIHRVSSNGKTYRALLQLTEKGLDAAAGVQDRVRIAVEKASAGLQEEERAVFYQVISLIAGNLQSICESGLQKP